VVALEPVGHGGGALRHAPLARVGAGPRGASTHARGATDGHARARSHHDAARQNTASCRPWSCACARSRRCSAKKATSIRPRSTL
jgi:hypothetical protein